VTTDPTGDRHAPRVDLITSSANSTYKFARSLHRRRIRQRERAILVEGTRAIDTVLQQGIPVRAMLVDAGRQSHVDPDLFDRLSRTAQRSAFLDSNLFEELAETEQPQPIIAVCDMPHFSVPEACSLVLAVDGVRDPGNLGTIIRSAAAADVDGVALLPGTVDVFNPKVIRSSAGSIFTVPVEQFTSVESLCNRCFTERPLVALAEGSGETPYDAVDWTQPSVIVVGGEAEGAHENTRTFADLFVQIPLNQRVESLNAAVAGAILLFEAKRQRRATR
jgi:RNA methyltransferase, TrmH family